MKNQNTIFSVPQWAKVSKFLSWCCKRVFTRAQSALWWVAVQLDMFAASSNRSVQTEMGGPPGTAPTNSLLKWG